jgi:hypothetical protein
VTLLPHLALVACLLLYLVGVPVPPIVFVALLAALPAWAIGCGWHRPLSRAFLLGPGTLIAAVVAFAVWVLVEGDFVWWIPNPLLALLVLGLLALYTAYCGIVFALAGVVRN